MQDRVDGSASLKYDGMAYFPTQNFWIFGDATVAANSPDLAMVADKIWFQGSVQVAVTHANPRNLPVTGPQTTFGEMLVKQAGTATPSPTGTIAPAPH